jgi:hypothetical protein
VIGGTAPDMQSAEYWFTHRRARRLALLEGDEHWHWRMVNGEWRMA